MSSTKRKCDIFISYRRDGGDMTAMYIYQELKARKYDVFYDLEVLRAGKFNDSLLEYIAACKDFLLVLSPGALDRCDDENDWVRKEIAEALRLKKNIIPVMLKGFKFPDHLPEEIDDARYQNGMTTTTEYFQESMNRLCKKYLLSKPKVNVKIPVAITAGVAIVAGLAASGKLYIDQNVNKNQPAVIESESSVETESPLTLVESESEVITETVAETEEKIIKPVSNTQWPRMREDSPWSEYDGKYATGEGGISEVMNMPVFHNEKILRKDVKSVTFLNTLEHVGEDAWDISEEQNGSVMAWTEENGELYDLYIAGEGGIRAPKDSAGIFCLYVNAESVTFNDAFDTSESWNLDSFFKGMTSLKNLDIRSLDTSSATNIRCFFEGCEQLVSLDVTSLDTTKVTEMNDMFAGCFKLKELDLSGFHTSRVNTMNSMFIGDDSLEKLTFGDGFVTSRVKDMTDLFGWCTNLEELDVSGFDTARVEHMDYMFEHCENLMELDVSGFDTTKVSSMMGMFEGCYMLGELDVSNWNVDLVKEFSNMFSQCNELLSIGTTEGTLYDLFTRGKKQTEAAKYWSRGDLFINSDSRNTVSVIWSNIDNRVVECPFAYDETSGHSYIFVNCPATAGKANGYWGGNQELVCINSAEELEFLEQWAQQENLNFNETWISGRVDPRVVYSADGCREEYMQSVNLDSSDYSVNKFWDSETDSYIIWDDQQPDESGYWLQLFQYAEDGQVILRMDDLDDELRRPFILETEREMKNGETLDISWWSYGGNEKLGYGEEYIFEGDIRGRLDIDGLLTIAVDCEEVSGDQITGLGPVDYNINVRKVVIKDGITEIGFHTFDNCTNLTDISIPESVTTIGGGAFMNAGLTKIYIPSNVTEIAEDAFDGIENKLTICGESGSYAEEFAKKRGIRFMVN